MVEAASQIAPIVGDEGRVIKLDTSIDVGNDDACAGDTVTAPDIIRIDLADVAARYGRCWAGVAVVLGDGIGFVEREPFNIPLQREVPEKIRRGRDSQAVEDEIRVEADDLVCGPSARQIGTQLSLAAFGVA